MLKTGSGTSVGVGTSTALDPLEAGIEAAELSVHRLGESACDFVFVFGGMGYDARRLLEGIRSVTGDVPLVGCSAQGVVAARWAREDPRVAGVMAVRSRDLIFTHAVCDGLGRDSYEVGCRLSRELVGSSSDDPVVLLCLYDPLTGVNADGLIRGLESVRPIRIFGGGASQPWGPIVETRQYFDGNVVQDSAVCVLISGRASVEIDLTHGAVPLGMEATITRAAGNVVYEIDGTPAYDAWKNLVGAGDGLCTDDIAHWAIGIRLPENLQDEYEGCVTRSLFKVDPDSGGIYLHSEIPEGTRVMFHHRTHEAVIERAIQMGERLRDRVDRGSPCFALSFECGARSTPFLGTRGALEEVRRVQQIIGEEVPWLGMYAWGEIAPVANSNYLHNYTFPVCVIMAGR